MKLIIVLFLTTLVLAGCSSGFTDDKVAEFCDSFIRQIEDDYNIPLEDRDNVRNTCADELGGYIPEGETKDVGLF